MYHFTSKIRYSETDSKNILKLYSLVKYLQDCSTFQAESIDMGIDKLRTIHRMWVVNAWQIDILDWEKLRGNNDIEIGTWMYDYKGIMANRNFVINDMEGNRLVNANSVWALLDTEISRPVRITDEDVMGYSKEEKIFMDYQERRITLPEDMKGLDSFPVRRHHLDSNNHVNNAAYFLMADEFLPQDFKPVRLRAEYRKSAVLGDIIYPMIAQQENRHLISLNDEQNKPYAIIEVTM